MTDHDCRCEDCDPNLVPSTIRVNEHHFGVQFGDTHCVVHKDGVVLRDVVEVFEGDRALRSRLHVCGHCGGSTCSYWDAGNYTVEIVHKEHG